DGDTVDVFALAGARRKLRLRIDGQARKIKTRYGKRLGLGEHETVTANAVLHYHSAQTGPGNFFQRCDCKYELDWNAQSQRHWRWPRPQAPCKRSRASDRSACWASPT